MKLIDSHCHVQDAKFDEDRDAVIARALEALEMIVVIGGDEISNPAALDLVQPGVYAVAGIHPYGAKDFNPNVEETLREQLAKPGVVALGEIGLDYYNEFSPRGDQRVAFVRQLEMAAELSLPVVIHNREADADTLAVLEDHAGEVPGVLMHCFGGDAACAIRCVEAGYYVSFAGNVTFPKAQPLRDAAVEVPLERLLVETDAPYLAPQPRRGKRCEPVDVAHTAALLAEVKGVPIEELTRHTTENARRFYGI